ncbi:RrF2 family transcriptional regulator [Sedimentibacter saalensis]|jgi:Rrf2 family protein|uniref:BadM/Rrf2 family transcriptional regulator n=1 Tax=Sedimentibacter saalensis TaxID=130788 RepID=A0A562JGZ0_9FIRM|nr:Rrf2 family transcriptional regulator [Sedimentibacter saalensis]MEA5094418.1 Rrf2 family transcriptional regulator [Sedimentibacter saalensis]TWH82477.1 BadM/Rrf2 family transcriptional regulator [Sedimentibacter saalensis]
MKISTKGRYGLRAVMDLCINSNGDYVSLISIAERQNISKNYLEQVFSALRKTGIVKSVKGSQGGYLLNGKTSEVTIGNILRALEGDLSVVKEEQSNSKIEHCIKMNLWDKIDQKLYEIIDNMTLEDLINEYNKGTDSMMYYI